MCFFRVFSQNSGIKTGITLENINIYGQQAVVSHSISQITQINLDASILIYTLVYIYIPIFFFTCKESNRSLLRCGPDLTTATTRTPLTRFCTDLTGITEETLASAGDGETVTLKRGGAFGGSGGQGSCFAFGDEKS